MEKPIKKLAPLFFIGALSLTLSCNPSTKTATTEPDAIQAPNDGQNEPAATGKTDQHLLIGSWLDLSQAALHFSMFEDGTARSDNMKTLLYKKWRVAGDTLILTAESIGNGTSSTGDEVFHIEELTPSKLVLKQGENLLEYKKK
ncbi:hypothetical protein GCM10023091_26770 [Ravibacter arvi]|uniref:Lipocalin-like domain-containing protein n=1 Tax=Ravibacter arvi TaxID=2051041 RepID=A0ABP8LZX0_9BACT